MSKSSLEYPINGAVFKELRGALSQEEAGRRVGRTQSYWSRLERAEKPITLQELDRIAREFGVSRRKLLTRVALTPPMSGASD